MMRFLFVTAILMIGHGCRTVDDFFRPDYEYSLSFYNRNHYDLANVEIKFNDRTITCGGANPKQFGGMYFMSVPVTKTVVCVWEKGGQPEHRYRKEFTLPASVEKKFRGTLMFFFTNDDVTLEYDLDWKNDKKCVENKYIQMSKTDNATKVVPP